MVCKLPSCLLLTLLLVGCGSGKANPNALEQRLATQVPLRSSPTQVLAFLDSQKIAHSPYHHSDNSGNSIDAAIAVPAPHSIVQPTYDVVFRFDDHDLLKAYDIQYLGYVGF